MSRVDGARTLQASTLLRLAAGVIAVAGLIDPAIAVSAATRARLAIVMPLPVSSAASAMRDRLSRDLSAAYDLVPVVTTDAAAAIVIGERYPEQPLPDALRVATVTMPAAAGNGARIIRVAAPREVPPATLIHLDVDLDAPRQTGQATDVTATIAGLEVGRASHRWTAGESHWRAGIDAVPVGEPPYMVQVRLKPDTAATADAISPVMSGFSRTVADVVVDVRRAPFRVEFYEPRPSWATTFLRRALEADPRFQVDALSETSRGVSAQTGGALTPGDPRLDAFDVVIVGGLDRLSAAEAGALERFMRERGGAVVVVPDQRIAAGGARDLVMDGVNGRVALQLDLAERLLEQPAKLLVTPPAPGFSASELLVLNTPAPGTDVVARLAGGGAPPAPTPAVVVSMPRGDGRLLLSGAMDAWRFRAADEGAFDRFWQSTIAGLALAVPPPIAISVDPPLLRPGERGDLLVRLRSHQAAFVSASLDGDQPIRLVPDPEAGAYRGRFTAKGAPGRSIVTVRAGDASASQALFVQSDVHRVRSSDGPSLAMLASSHHGIDVAPERIAALEDFVRSAVAVPRSRQIRHPMRSAWWIVPFGACLSAEWWLRRRKGLR